MIYEGSKWRRKLRTDELIDCVHIFEGHVRLFEMRISHSQSLNPLPSVAACGEESLGVLVLDLKELLFSETSGSEGDESERTSIAEPR